MKHLAWLCALVITIPVLAQAPRPKAPAPPVRGLSPERLARIAPVMNQFVSEGRFPGMAVVVARDGKVAFQQEFGYADVEKQTPLGRDAIHRIFSMTKPVTGVAVMILLEEGRFVLDDPVSKYIPCFKDLQVFDGEKDGTMALVPTAREVTIRDLLRQTSGLSYGNGTDAVGRMYQAKDLFDPATSLEQMTAKACSLPLYFQPGTKWEYSVAIDVLGRLVEVVSGQPLDVFMQKRIFDPLRMVDTSFYIQDGKEGRLTTCYSYTPDKGLTPLPAARGIDRYRRDRNHVLSGGGGLLSTSADYMRFATMLARGGELDGVRILGPRTVALMSMNQLPGGVEPAFWGGKNGGNGYGFTMSVTTDVAKTTGYGSVGDFGWDGAASTFFRIDPKEKLVILLMTQRMPTDLEIQVKLKTLVYQALVQ